MKLLHTSDWHLGAVDNNRSLYDDQKFFIDRICDIVSAQAVDAVLIAGDVYDRSLPSAQAVELYDYAMTRLCKQMHTPVLCIAGNHDSAERLSSCGALLSMAGLYVAGSLERDVPKVSLGDTDIYLLPWITAEKVRSIFPEKREEISSLEDAYRVMTNHIREGFEKGRRHILLSHAFITDSETSTSDRSAEIGTAAQVPAFVFDGFDYVALGHIHKPQDVTDAVRYSGTPMPYAFGKEEKQQKSVTILDTSDLSRTIVPLPLLHLRTSIEGTLTELLEGDISEDIHAGFVRIHVLDCHVGLETMHALKEVYPNALDIRGKEFENENSTISMTLEEFEAMENSPVEVFRSFCIEQMGEEADAHYIALFEQAIREVQEAEA